jgi:hypothetical protein
VEGGGDEQDAGGSHGRSPPEARFICASASRPAYR